MHEHNGSIGTYHYTIGHRVSFHNVNIVNGYKLATNQFPLCKAVTWPNGSSLVISTKLCTCPMPSSSSLSSSMSMSPATIGAINSITKLVVVVAYGWSYCSVLQPPPSLPLNNIPPQYEKRPDQFVPGVFSPFSSSFLFTNSN